MARYSRIVAACLMASTALAPAMAAAPVAADGGTRQMQSSGTAAPVAAATASVDGIAVHEFRPDPDAVRSGEPSASGPDLKNVQFGPVDGEAQAASPLAMPATNQRLSFNGLTARQQRLANGGNQFTVEPPDQGLCVGNGFVLETVNDVLRIFDTSGNPVTGVVDLNTFYGYPAQFVRPAGPQGPFVTDPSCLYDTATQRWFHLVLTLEVFPDTGDFTGKNHLDLAVSQTADPTGKWTRYQLDVTDDGSGGTPNHGCQPGPGPRPGHHAPTNPNACIGDFPHLGADQHGIYLTTNEYWMFGNPTPTNAAAYHAAQIYAIGKHALVSGGGSVSVTQIDTLGRLNGQPGFTVWPAVSPSTADYETSGNGTEYFTSTNAAEEASNVPNSNGTNASNQLGVWALSNTASLKNVTPNLKLRTATVQVNRYTVPLPSNQKPGSAPLKDCINDTTSPTIYGPGCWQIFFFSQPPPEVEGQLDSSDSRVLSTVFAAGHLYGTLDTGITVGGQKKAAVQYYVLSPEVDDGHLSAELDRQGRIIVPNNNTIYGAVAVTHAGRALINFTLVGDDHFPSAAYVSLNSKVTPANIHIAAKGLGPQDGFSEYNAFGSGNPPKARPRWGDYGAAVAVGNTIWMASEYTGQTCTLAEYYPGRNATPPSLAGFGACGGTRVSLANSYTRITAVDVSVPASDDEGDNQN
jgi:hypothetical protein